MFSKAKRFNYPKPEAPRSEKCLRFAVHDDKFSRSFEQRNQSLHSSFKTPRSVKKAKIITSKLTTTPVRSVTQEFATSSAKSEDSKTQCRFSQNCNRNNCRSLSSTSSDYQDYALQFEECTDSAIEMPSPSISPDEPTKSEMLQKLEDLESRLNQKIQNLEHLLQDKITQKTAILECNTEQQMGSLNSSLNDIKRNLNYLVFLKNQEQDMAYSPDYQKFVEFCTDVILEVSIKLCDVKKKKKNSFEKFLKNFANLLFK